MGRNNGTQDIKISEVSKTDVKDFLSHECKLAVNEAALSTGIDEREIFNQAVELWFARKGMDSPGLSSIFSKRNSIS